MTTPPPDTGYIICIICIGRISRDEKTILKFVATKEFIEKVDDYRFQHRFKTGAVEIRFLIEWALKEYPNP